VITLVALLLAVFVLPSPWGWVAVIVGALVDILEWLVFTWWSKRRRAAVGVETLVGRRASVASALRPRGQVRLDGEIWAAESTVPVDPGAEVVVVSVDGLVLHVEPVEGD
jgi:membrane protein implicated in regulation of membrane protease activity